MVERLGMFPAGGRGTDREPVDIGDDIEPLRPPPLLDEDPPYDRILFCGGRGTL
jgi:hypothetical protein